MTIAILGAGLAGLSLAEALLDAGVGSDVVLVDRRTTWDRDRTWCTWDTEGTAPLRHVARATHRWWAWETSWAGESVVARTARHPYVHLDSRVVYDAALDRLGDDSRIHVRAGESVLSVTSGRRGATIRTDRETFDAARVVDALGPGSPLLPAARRPAPGDAWQRFLGWEVVCDRPVFDPQTATLMDLRGSAAGALAFLYVLPFAADRALVEHTTIGRGGPPTSERERLLHTELTERRGAGGYEVLHVERGAIPMSPRLGAAVREDGVLAVGAAAGAIRPSSGYAFSRTQRHVAALAGALVAGRRPPSAVDPPHRRALDRLFLRALRAAPDGGAALFAALARAAPADVFARFMSDAADVGDEARVAAALPVGTMSRAVLGR